jgi:predicted heme/steroid binding protein
MALVVKDRVRETSTTTGTGTFTLAGAVTGFQTFSTAIGNTNTTYYTITNGSEWEVGIGTVAAGTLARTTIVASSNAGSAVNFSAGTKDVFCSYPADKAIYTGGSYSNPSWITSISGSIVSGNISGNAANITGTYAGTITSSQVTTGLGYTPPSNATTLSINGTSYDLSANRTWSVGTVTSVAALTLGTTGTDLSSTVATGTSTPVITLNIPTASATNRGALSSADWTTFNNKQPAGTYVTSISVASSNGFAGTSSGGATPSLTISTSITGLLKGNGTTISAGTVGTDYVAPSTATNFTAQQYFGNVALTDGATISWAANTAQVATFTFVSSNRTMGAPTGLVNGAFYALAVIQNAGSNTITWNSVFKWAGGTAPTLSTAASAKDYFVFRSDGTNLYEQGRSLGVA